MLIGEAVCETQSAIVQPLHVLQHAGEAAAHSCPKEVNAKVPIIYTYLPLLCHTVLTFAVVFCVSDSASVHHTKIPFAGPIFSFLFCFYAAFSHQHQRGLLTHAAGQKARLK